MDLEFYTVFRGYELKVKVRGYRPSRPAPACSNPDSPLYSDPGDDAEISDYDVFFAEHDPKTKKVHLFPVPDDMVDFWGGDFDDLVYQESEGAFGDMIGAAEEAHWEAERER